MDNYNSEDDDDDEDDEEDDAEDDVEESVGGAALQTPLATASE